MNRKLLISATLVGAVAQLMMVGAGHFIPFIKDNLFALGGMAISLAAGILYAARAGGGWGPATMGGAVAGGVCAFLGIGVSLLLGDVPAMVLAFGTVASAVAGVVGGAIGKVMKRA